MTSIQHYGRHSIFKVWELRANMPVTLEKGVPGARPPPWGARRTPWEPRKGMMRPPGISSVLPYVILPAKLWGHWNGPILQMRTLKYKKVKWLIFTGGNRAGIEPDIWDQKPISSQEIRLMYSISPSWEALLPFYLLPTSLVPQTRENIFSLKSRSL